jgi:hypothetical protein
MPSLLVWKGKTQIQTNIVLCMEETEPSVTHVEGGESKWKVKSLMCTEEDVGSRKSLVPITQLHMDYRPYLP